MDVSPWRNMSPASNRLCQVISEKIPRLRMPVILPITPCTLPGNRAIRMADDDCVVLLRNPAIKNDVYSCPQPLDFFYLQDSPFACAVRVYLQLVREVFLRQASQ